MNAFAERLSARDRLFLDLEGANAPQHVAVLCWLDAKPLRGADGALDLALIRRRIEARLHAVPRTRQRLAFAPVDRHPVWVDDASFDLALHVLHTALPKPGGERELAKLVGRLVAEPVDRERPLWELWFIEGVTRTRCALLAKVHHCMVDGVGGFDWFGRLLVSAKGEQIAEPPPWTPRPAPDRDELLRREIGHRAERWLGALRKLPRWLESREELESIASRAVERATTLGETLSAALEPAPTTPFNAPLGPLRGFAWRSLAMSRVDALRAGLGGTVNEVALACVAGALRSLLIAEGAEVEGVTLRASVPVNRRRAGDPDDGGNRVAICVIELAVGISDVRERYAAIREASARAKASHQVEGLELLDEVAELTTSALVGAAARVALQNRPFNLVVTNIPGPSEPLRLLGAKLHALAPVVNLTEGVGLGVALASYAGQLSFGCIADPHLVPGLAAFADAILSSFEELEKSVA
ncbi:MAG: wax ester/triacylglycerol synthase family O-acyltransferase [Deltaproteobacteria bacterium]|nr:wax ester/triacylglycerol synthase family O-acyltransferase [Deltaproteobacteria bacterium]